MSELHAATGTGIVRIEPESGTATSLLDAPGVQCLAVDSRDPSRIFAGSRGGGLLVSEDAGSSWRDTGLPERDVFSVAVSPANGAVYAGAEPSALHRSDDNGRTWGELASLKEIPSAPTWSFPPRPWTSHVRWIAPNPVDSDLLLVGIELGGLMRSEDGGATWADHAPGAQPDVHALAWHPAAPERAYEAGGAGAAFSLDGGRSWQGADDGRDRHYTWALAVDPADPDTWFVSANPGPMQAHRDDRAAEAYIYRRRGNRPWEALDGGLPQPLDSMPYALVFDGDTLYAGLADGRLYAGSRDGTDWERVELGDATPPSIVAFAAV
jgi:hypothetical protein